MKTYAVRLVREFVTYAYVNANSVAEAEAQTWDKLNSHDWHWKEGSRFIRNAEECDAAKPEALEQTSRWAEEAEREAKRLADEAGRRAEHLADLEKALNEIETL